MHRRRLPRAALSQHLPSYSCDVLIIGSGAAGLTAAIHASSKNSSVIVITKEALGEGITAHAQGGISAVMDPADTFEGHINDTVLAGAGLCDTTAVETLVSEAPARINDLISWGMPFDRDGGELSLTREGGHRHNRIVHAQGDRTGKVLSKILSAKTQSTSAITVMENTMCVSLLSKDARGYGAIALDTLTGSFKRIYAKATIMATGGAGQIFRETTNPVGATGDGYAVAVGAKMNLRDMEFAQFHPTALYVAGAPRFLISEAVRGEGAVLVNAAGEPFMKGIHELADLAPRDIVARAIINEMARDGRSNVFLDLSHIPEETIRRRFPGILHICSTFGVDITKDRIPVSPCAHYLMGGIETDLNGATSIEGVFACGETARTGVHGANRLASNSLLEALVFGKRAADTALCTLYKGNPMNVKLGEYDEGKEPEDFNIIDGQNSVKSLMWKNCGIVRQPEKLEHACSTLHKWEGYINTLGFESRQGLELQSLLTTGCEMVEAATKRNASVGAHYLDKDSTNA